MIGWRLPRALAEIAAELAALRAAWQADREQAAAQAAELRTTKAELAAVRTTLDWLTVHVNRLERERARLLERYLGLTFPVPELAREAPAREATVAPSGIVGQPLTEEAYAQTIAALQAAGSAFEDVGDEVAQRLGVTHDEFGNLRHTR